MNTERLIISMIMFLLAKPIIYFFNHKEPSIHYFFVSSIPFVLLFIMAATWVFNIKLNFFIPILSTLVCLPFAFLGVISVFLTPIVLPLSIFAFYLVYFHLAFYKIYEKKVISELGYQPRTSDQLELITGLKAKYINEIISRLLQNDSILQASSDNKYAIKRI